MRPNMREHNDTFQHWYLLMGIGIAAPACAAQAYQYGYPGRRNSGYDRDVERRAYETGYREAFRRARTTRGAAAISRTRGTTSIATATMGTVAAPSTAIRIAGRSGRVSRPATASRSTATRGTNGRFPRVNPYPNDRGGFGYPANRGVYRSPASDIGYRDGIEAGRNDARDRDPFDPVRAKRYRDGDHDYNSRYGSREEYKREYRAAFEQGYREGYRRSR